MGLIRTGKMREVGAPKELMLLLRDALHADTFVETGTYEGETSAWAASHFRRVITIEASQKLHEQACSRWNQLPNVSFLFGNSRKVLREVVPTLGNRAIFWLDGHWSAGGTYGKDDECPLLEEIAIINGSAHEQFLFIDDVRYLMKPPPKPHDPGQWPSLDEVIQALQAGAHRYFVAILDDVMIAIPANAKDVFIKYCRGQKVPLMTRLKGVFPRVRNFLRDLIKRR